MDITSFVLGYKKGKAEGGGALTEDVCHVTFMNGDTVLYEKPVFVGDDCTDIVKKGTIGTPSKASTPQYNYDYTGWSLANGGEASTEALAAVSGDRTVYAAYESVLRYYTITYLDDNGSVLKTESLAYGDMPSYVPTKEGSSFDSWQPALATVTGDVTYTAKWIENVTFAGGAWADIARVSEAGEAADYFEIGDTKTIEADGQTITLRIIGFGHDDLANGSGKAGMTIVAESVFTDTMTVEDWNTLSNEMKSKIKPKLPNDLQAAIKTVIKPCDVATSAVDTPVNVEFDLFPLSYEEMKIRRHSGRLSTDSDWGNCFTLLGTPYQYFENKYTASKYMGPKGTYWATSHLMWLRQWGVFGTSVYGMYGKTNINTSASQYATNVARTELHPVIVAFCI